MSEPFIGQLMLVPYNFAPRGWALCNGQLLQISQNTALFSLLGTTYGGDGVKTFALPDLRGRVPVSSGQGPGLSNYDLGAQLGYESVTLTSQQIAQHSHPVNVVGASAGTSGRPVNNFLAQSQGGAIYSAGPSDGATMNSATIGLGGGNQPHENRQPTLVLNWIIALEGIYPSRS